VLWRFVNAPIAILFPAIFIGGFIYALNPVNSNALMGAKYDNLLVIKGENIYGVCY